MATSYKFFCIINLLHLSPYLSGHITTDHESSTAVASDDDDNESITKLDLNASERTTFSPVTLGEL